MVSLEEFTALASRANVIPLTRRIVADIHTPVSIYLAMREGNSFLFESVEPNEKIGRYSFVGVNPVAILRARGKQTELRTATETTMSNETIFDAASRLLSGYRYAEVDGLSGFTGGLVGYIGYPNVSHLENIPYHEAGIDDEDDAVLGLFPTLVRFDHRDQVITIIHCVLLSEERPIREQYEAGRQTLDAVELRLRRGVLAPQNFACSPETLEDGGSVLCCRGTSEAPYRRGRHLPDGAFTASADAFFRRPVSGLSSAPHD
jgi:anthranilate synthase component I